MTSSEAGSAIITSGDLCIDLDHKSVSLQGRGIHLTPTEYNLLRYLATHAGRVLTHPMILREVWGEEYVTDTTVLRTYVNQLRTKLGDDLGRPRFIRTEPRIGYRFMEAAPSDDRSSQ